MADACVNAHNPPVLAGASIYGCSPELIRARCSRLTYGVRFAYEDAIRARLVRSPEVVHRLGVKGCSLHTILYHAKGFPKGPVLLRSAPLHAHDNNSLHTGPACTQDTSMNEILQQWYSDNHFKPCIVKGQQVRGGSTRDDPLQWQTGRQASRYDCPDKCAIPL